MFEIISVIISVVMVVVFARAFRDWWQKPIVEGLDKIYFEIRKPSKVLDDIVDLLKKGQTPG